ncbi:MAG: four helix bundle protein [Bacteroidota bacterium]
MQQRDHTEFNKKVQKRFLAFAVAVFRFLESIPNSNNKRIIAYQLGKSASSCGANFRAFCRGRSKNEKFAKMCIVVEEADESEYWLQILEELQMGANEKRTELLKEIDELVRISVTIKGGLR